MKNLAEEFDKKFTCLGEDTEKYITYTFSTEREVTQIDENGEESTKIISYRLQLIDSERFIASSLTNLVNNCFERIHKMKCKYGHDDKSCVNWRIGYKYATVFLNTQTLKII